MSVTTTRESNIYSADQKSIETSVDDQTIYIGQDGVHVYMPRSHFQRWLKDVRTLMKLEHAP